MGIRIIAPKTLNCNFPYINSVAGVKESDGVALIVRPLTTDEIADYEDKVVDVTSYKINRQAGKGFRDRGKDPRSEVKYTIDNVQLRHLRRDRIRKAVVGWEGILGEDGTPMPYNWENFLRVVQLIPDFMDFADECIERASDGAYMKIQELQESEKNSPVTASSD